MRCQILTYNTHGLPWSRDESKPICGWIKRIRPEIVFLQEVFVESIRTYYKEQLELLGYKVCIPNDTDVTLLSSGLVTAVSEKVYHVKSECFCAYQQYHNVEWFANKGFHVLRLIHTPSGRHINIVNTHTQSDTEVSWFFGRAIVARVRRAQIEQILGFFGEQRVPVLVGGDLNCEHSPHPHLRFLHPASQTRIRKATFYSTGEDLDHFGWLPLQWAHPDCAFCNIDKLGPRLEACSVFHVPWSDHAPVLATIFVPIQNRVAK